MKKLLILLPLAFYLRLISGFFQQDEWFSFSWFIQHQGSLGYAWTPLVTHYNPLTVLANHLFFSLWNMNYQAFLLISLFLHGVVLVLVYILAKEVFRKDWPAAITAFLFGTFAAYFQAVAWVVVSVSTQMATILGLLSVIFFLRKRLFVSLFLLVISLLFKEITIGLFPLFLFYIFLFAKKDKFYSRDIMIIIGVGAVYALARVLMLFSPNIAGGQLVTQSQNALRIIYNFITVPIKAISQSIVPIQILRGVSDFLARLFPEKISGEFGSPAFEVFVVKRVLEVVSLLTSLAIGAWMLAKMHKSKIVVLGLFWIVVNSFIFAFAPERSGVISVIDSRNLYFASVGAALMLTAVADKISKSDIKKMAALLLVVIIPNLYFLNQNLVEFTRRGEVRKSILTTIQLVYPDLPDKVVVYTQSNQPYYGLPPETKILPFQSGLGQTLLVWYYPTEKFPKEFFADRFLWDIEEQGYKEVGDHGFGYFRDLDLLRDAIGQYNLPGESVIAFSWDGKKNFLTDITQEVRNEIYDQEN
ncbi:hypothetical protein A2975_02730 [Candidatus Woesebacteria bacterium RIFCSPLOWO2_01_FULL_44_14]|uniref:Glycosyltransferase RgtA/B/C/D-like domain-containing protein n=1 Tax=Candidatus Woesebacteria bacterium RIFCSPLOWO2_01_FULL_44_14 TaxID=1802525 RepID=A0A1F8C3N8_9BACT|nr:MAG: hypothetical protein A2975_02730 [Candidatus Woesebacteria bacterium RIFCSPLOWO2_01_FULL_44_14]